MPVDKRVPRKLNSSKDSRVQGKDEFNDALNIRIGDDYANIGGGAATTSDSGDAGVIKPALGNEEVANNGLFTTPQTERRVLGSVPDTRTGAIFFFVFSSDPDEMGVYAIDTQGYFGAQGQQVRVFTTGQFNFNAQSFVRGEVVHLYDEDATNEQDQFRPYLYFTDNINEPRRLDVSRALAAQVQYVGQAHNIVDFITACPKTPLAPITYEWQTDLSRAVSEFRNVNGFTFAYQCIYESGEESALSTFSSLAVPPVILNAGSSNNQNLNTDNLLRLTINKALFADQGAEQVSYNYTDEIDRIRILVREGDVGTWFIIDEVPAPTDAADIVYDFYNDRVLTGIRVEDANKQFDNLPQMAQALAVVENRLFYGNYVEGYDNGTVTASMQISYINRPNDFVDVNITATPVILPKEGLQNIDDQLAQQNQQISQRNARVAGFMIDTSDVNVDVPASSVINFSLRVQPARHWHLYDGTNSYHSHRTMGVGSPASDPSTFNPEYQSTGIYPQIPIKGNNDGVRNGSIFPNPTWHTTEVGGFGEIGNKECVYGTSAANPFVIQGKAIEFSFVAITTTDIPAAQSAQLLNNIITQTIGGLENPNVDLIGDPQLVSGYNINIPLDFVHTTNPNLSGADELQAKHAKLRPTVGEELTYINCITAVFDQTLINHTASAEINPCPMGYFLIRNANVQFSLINEGSLATQHNVPSRGFLSLELDYLNVQGAWDAEEPGIVTCIPQSNDFDGNYLASDSMYLKEWRVYKYYDLINSPNGTMYYDDQVAWQRDQRLVDTGGATNPFVNFFAVDYLDGLANGPVNGYNTLSRDQRALWIGGLQYEQGDAGTEGAPFRNNLILTNNEPAGDFGQPRFSLLDGEGGLRNVRRAGAVNNQNSFNINSIQGQVITDLVGDLIDDEASVLVYDAVTSQEEGLYSYPAIVLGHLSQAGGGFGIDVTSSAQSFLYPFAGFTTIPTGNNQERFIYWVLNNSPVATQFPNMTVSMFSGTAILYDNDPYPPAAAANIIASNIFFTEGEDGNVVRSFKSSANHQLGIVYYDERGRSGPVAPLPSRQSPSVYVEGYNPNTRNGLLGRVEMLVSMDTPPPDWAWYYQFVYAGNSTYDDFYQFTTGGAFVPNSDVSEAKVIYVSLNYLQSNKDVSYAEAWGAVDYTGDKTFYQYVPGDYLRIISYHINDDNRVFPIDYTFEIADVVELEDNPDINPIAGGVFVDDGAGVHPARRGSFVVLRDNPAAAGFTAAQVASATSLIDTSAHFWNNRCLVEIVRPKKLADSEDRVYYEIGQAYRITRIDGVLQHQYQQHLIREGDVWWRRVPMNVTDYDSEQALFPNLIQEENEEELVLNAPRFRDMYAESMTFSDGSAGNNVRGLGKPKIVGPERQRVRRSSSITFSDQNDYATNVNRFTSFNQYNAPFKDLPNEYGPINFLLNYNDSLFVIQKDKASSVPVSRDIISTATGQDSITVSNKILGSQIHYAGSYGSDNNPESVLKVDNNVYFVHKRRGEVYRFNPSNGIQVISDKGMATHLYDELAGVAQGGPAVKVVSGYDPLNDEYLITVNIIPVLTQGSFNLFDRPSFSVEFIDVSPTTAIDDTSGDTGGTGGTGGPPVFDFDTEVFDTDEEIITDDIDPNWDQVLIDKEVFDGDLVITEEFIAKFGQFVNTFDAAQPSDDPQIPFAVFAEVFVDGENPDFPFAGTTTIVTVGGIVIPKQDIPEALRNKIGESVITNRVSGTVMGTYYPDTSVLVFTPAGITYHQNVVNSNLGVVQDFNDRAKRTIFGGPDAGFISSYDITGYSPFEINPYTVNGDWVTADQSLPMPFAAHLIRATGATAISGFNREVNLYNDATQLNFETEKDLETAAAIEAEILDYLATSPSNATLLAYVADVAEARQAVLNVQETLPYDTTTIPFTLTGSPSSQLEVEIGYGIDWKNTPRFGPADTFFTAFRQALIDLQDTVRSVNPNNLTDTDGVFAALSSRIASLENTVDVLTDQLENTSSSVVDGGLSETPLLPNITSGQANFLSLAQLANQFSTLDRDITAEDILSTSDLGAFIQFSLESLSGVAITTELVEQILLSWFNLGDVYVDRPSFYDANNVIRNSEATKTDLNQDGATTTADLLQFLIFFGDPNEDYSLTQDQYQTYISQIAAEVAQFYA